MMSRWLALRSLRLASRPPPLLRPRAALARTAVVTPSAGQRPLQSRRHFATSKSAADLAIEDITELYATAQDEFEIAMEETEKVSVYAEEDRKAAREELEKVQGAYKKIVEGQDKSLAEEVSKRIGQRVRELEQGVARMEEMAMEQD